MKTYNYPFCAIEGQSAMKEALLVNLVNPAVSGVLIRGQKGTAKTTAVRALTDLLPDLRVVELPANATEDRVVGTLDAEHAVKTGEKQFEPGLLAEADRNILYADEINLLDDRIVDLLLDAAATGVSRVERDGISCVHPARFVLIGTMNPEEGSLRPQLLDRFGMVVDVQGEMDPAERVKILEDRLAFEENSAAFCAKYAPQQDALREQIRTARHLLHSVQTDRARLLQAAEIGIAFGTEGHRADLSMIKVAQALAALDGRTSVTEGDIKKAALYVLPHRMKQNPMDPASTDRQEIVQRLVAMEQESDADPDDAEDG